MICPHCNREIQKVKVYSEVYQKAFVDGSGKVVYCGPVEEILETTDIEHDGFAEGHDCYGNLTDIID